ncbi:OsmC family protein [Aquipuribacter sp. SD81]|uniref:OsmC family protein n=1 Tax=Aquipuribacter sp. SD81 TaxID=3127703 RepID=UPI0030165427
MHTFDVVAGAGSLTPPDATVRLPHRWTDGGVGVVADFTGAHLLHLSVAGCVLNDCYREAAALGVPLAGVRVEAGGGFDEQWASTGVTFTVSVDSPADGADVTRLLARVDEVAEIPRALRAGAPVRRAP